MPTASSRQRPHLAGGGLAAVASVSFGMVTVLGKIATNTGVSVTGLLAIRFGVAAVLLFLLLVVLRQPLRPARGEWLRLAILGLIGYAAESGFFFAALRHGTVAAVTLLFFTHPVWIALGSMALGRGMPGWLVGGALVCAVAGAAVVVTSSGGIDISALGIALAFASAITYSGYLLGADAVLKETPSLTAAAWVSGSAAVGLAIAAVVSGEGGLPPTGHAWWAAIGMGAGTSLAFVALFGALRRLGAVRTAIVSALEPVAASVLAFAILGDMLRLGTLAGGALIVAGGVAASVARGNASSDSTVP